MEEEPIGKNGEWYTLTNERRLQRRNISLFSTFPTIRMKHNRISCHFSLVIYLPDSKTCVQFFLNMIQRISKKLCKLDNVWYDAMNAEVNTLENNGTYMESYKVTWGETYWLLLDFNNQVVIHITYHV